MGGPAFSGASQLTCRLVLDSRRHRRRERRVRGLGVDVRDPDRHVDRVGPAPAVPRPHRHRVARLLLVVQRRSRLYLPAAAGGDDVERVDVRSLPGSRSVCRRRGRGPRQGCRRRRPAAVFSATLNVNAGAAEKRRGSCWPRPGSATPCPSATSRCGLRGCLPAPAPRSACPPSTRL